MRYLGIDVGYSRCGWGIIDDNDTGLTMVECGVIKTSDQWTFPERINAVYGEILRIIDFRRIGIIGVERPIHGQNVTNSVEVGAAYGAVLLASLHMDIPTLIHFPTQVKAAVANGRASKSEVTSGVMLILSLETPPRPDDAADALATAICARDNYRQTQLIKESTQ